MALTSPIGTPSGAAVIHASAIIEHGAEIGVAVSIGPFCHVGADVVLEDGVSLVSHVSVAGATTVGARTRIYPFASIGHPPQDLKYRDEPVRLSIGPDCLIREGVTMNPGTAGGGSETIVGAHSVFLANSHVAHDCRLGENVILSNNVMLAGHCRIGDFAILGGGAAVHQFARIGAHAFIGGLAGVEHDVIPFGIALGNRAALAGLNVVGLKRRGFDRDAIRELHRLYRLLFTGDGTLKERVESLAIEFAGQSEAMQLLDFIREGGDRAICMPRPGKDENV
ncbi:MAG TPA: acyl-ACP--UDP-N-acetylglucosamine O-acyltransferase [Roseiarcus sp.]|jgi:UDP-N-acetylglucosamine acyltransferase|nr:acyl-ACP--UDP-N-acetylglucosamine O-acyltransferase [Roseiarcus sp.]